MALRLLSNQYIIRRHYTYLALLSSSKFHYKPRFNCYNLNGNKSINLIPYNGTISKRHVNHKKYSHSKRATHSRMVIEFNTNLTPNYQRILTLCAKTKYTMHHFWCGTKLMGTDIRNGFKILMKLMNGLELSYRERRELRIVTMDALKFVPMLVIVLIPFLEATLPFLLYFFPNMLPSRFQTENMKIEKRKKILCARIGFVAFFEQILDKSLLNKIKNNQQLLTEEIIEFASLFDDEKALNYAPHSVLCNMCRCLDLSAYGTTAMLRTRLCNAIREIRREDEGIKEQGLDTIPLCLLEQLTVERGMRNDFQELVLRGNLNKWLQLSLDNKVPFSLLLISQIFDDQKQEAVCI